MIVNNPDRQDEIAKNPFKAYFGNYPELVALKITYGENAPIAWLIPQLKNLSEYCGVKEKMTTEMLLGCAKSINTYYYYLKTSELMIFFHRFKAGYYGEFYGAVDPMRIMVALKTFVNRERNSAIDAKIKADAERRRKQGRENCISYDEYLRLKEEEEKAK